MIKKTLISLLLLSFFSLSVVNAQTTPAESDSMQTNQQRTISVSASGSVFAEPDIATIQLGVDSSNEDIQVAQSNMETTMQSIMTTLQNAGIDEQDIRTVNFSIYQDERRDPEGNIQSRTYHVINSVEVTVRNIPELGSIISQSVAAGANTINNIQFTISNPAELEAQAREVAMQNAKAKAQQLATLADSNLGAVLMINEGGYSFPVASEKMFMADMARSTPISAGQLEVSVNVNVLYALE